MGVYLLVQHRHARLVLAFMPKLLWKILKISNLYLIQLGFHKKEGHSYSAKELTKLFNHHILPLQVPLRVDLLSGLIHTMTEVSW